jgi:HD-GYP domain-containing protein (c-di-GMP phosphodiesterase class II)
MIRRFGTLARPWALLPIFAAAALSIERPAFLQFAERATYDTLLRLTRPHQPDGRVVIVDIDERSLAAVGQWPWRRDVIGTLVSRVRSLGASAIALDVLFSEPERADAGATSTDAQLADTLRGGRVVLGYALTFENAVIQSPPCLQHPLGLAIVGGADGDADPFFQATGAICSLPGLTKAAGASGFLNAAPDSDGILRRVPLLLLSGGRIYPSLALAAVATATHARIDRLRIANANTLWLTLDGSQVPLDGKSHLLVRYRGTKRTFPYVSAADVLNGRLDPAAFENKIVFIGTTALGTREVVATPLDTLFAAVEVQATVADNLLRNDFLRRPEYAIALETLAVFAFGGLTLLIVSWLGLTGGIAAVLLCGAAGWAGATLLLSSSGAFVSPLFPTLSVAGTLAVIAVARLTFERSRADRAVADKATSRSMMIQSLLSLTETRDAETGQHSRRTQRHMQVLAEELARHPGYRPYLTTERIELLSALAPLHDIGKVGVADRVLGKPGALTHDEVVEMRKHPIFGRDVIARAQAEIAAEDDGDGVLALAKEIVYTHHEKWDGTGYPQGLRGSEIPVAGRLMAVVDVYDATVTRRRYQPGMSHDDALRVIVEGRGSHFDPAVVDAFVAVSGVLRDAHAGNHSDPQPPANFR